MLEKILESPLDCKEIQTVHPKGNQSWIFIGRTVVETETRILWPPDKKSWLIWKDPYSGKDLKVGGEGDDSGWDGWMASPAQWTWVWVNSGSWWWSAWHAIVHGDGKSQTWLSDWTDWYGNKIDNLEEMDRFLEKFNLPRLNQEEIEIMNNPITNTEIEAVIKNIPETKARWLHRRILSNI